jgi:biopolymer transport protein ExbB/TolQ
MIELLGRAAAVGSAWVIWILLALSMISVSVIVERWLFFRRRRFDLRSFSTTLTQHLRKADYEGVHALLAAHPSIEAAVLQRCLQWLDDGPEALSEALEPALGEQREKLEQGAVFLGTVGNNAPFVGLLGTVLGVVQAFQELEKSAGSAMGSVMGGVAEALIATAVGILVALPAVVAHNVFNKKASQVEDNARSLLHLVLASLKSKRSKSTTDKA